MRSKAGCLECLEYADIHSVGYLKSEALDRIAAAITKPYAASRGYQCHAMMHATAWIKPPHTRVSFSRRCDRIIERSLTHPIFSGCSERDGHSRIGRQIVSGPTDALSTPPRLLSENMIRPADRLRPSASNPTIQNRLFDAAPGSDLL